MLEKSYLMESDEETLRLDMKTDSSIVKRQALWAGLKPGMRVADLGFGSGKTTYCLNELVQPSGMVVGLDISEDRIKYAENKYYDSKINYLCRDICEPLDDLGQFDFVWVRFVLEYYRSTSFKIVENISRILKPGGILCLIDLDHNCLNHFGLSPRLEKTIFKITGFLESKLDFDPYIGRKLYSFLFDLDFENIEVDLAAHHLIYGHLEKTDAFNWGKKFEVAVKNSGYTFSEYEGKAEVFFEDFMLFFEDRRRFSYTPVISCRGQKPLNPSV